MASLLAYKPLSLSLFCLSMPCVGPPFRNLVLSISHPTPHPREMDGHEVALSAPDPTRPHGLAALASELHLIMTKKREQHKKQEPVHKASQAVRIRPYSCTATYTDAFGSIWCVRCIV